MGVYVPHLSMPNCCYDCIFKLDDMIGGDECCTLDCKIELDEFAVPQECPLIEVPYRHGPLIDASELRKSFSESIEECNKWANEVENSEIMYARVSQSLGTFVEASLRTKAMPAIIPEE